MTDAGEREETAAAQPAAPLLEMERGARGRFRLRRRPARPGEGQALWVRVGLRSHVPVGVALSLAAIACAMIGAATLLVLTLTSPLSR